MENELRIKAIQQYQVIENKRKHLVLNLSAAQRDYLFTKEIESDTEFLQELVQLMKE